MKPTEDEFELIDKQFMLNYYYTEYIRSKAIKNTFRQIGIIIICTALLLDCWIKPNADVAASEIGLGIGIFLASYIYKSDENKYFKKAHNL